MPFDGKNFTETKPALFTRDDLIAFLETLDPNEELNSSDFRNCLMGRYYRDRIVEAVKSGVDYRTWIDAQGHTHTTPFDHRFLIEVIKPTPFERLTFGVALSRALALREKA